MGATRFVVVSESMVSPAPIVRHEVQPICLMGPASIIDSQMLIRILRKQSLPGDS